MEQCTLVVCSQCSVCFDGAFGCSVSVASFTVILVSGSGGTATLLPFVKKAKEVGAKLAVISMKKSSAMADVANLVVQVGQDDSFAPVKGMPMGSQFELSTLVFLEGAISELIFAEDLTEQGMRTLHANLE